MFDMVWGEKQVETKIYWSIRNCATFWEHGINTGFTVKTISNGRCFHVAMLRNYEPSHSHVINSDDIEFEKNATYGHCHLVSKWNERNDMRCTEGIVEPQPHFFESWRDLYDCFVYGSF